MSHLVEKSTGVVNFPQVPAYSISRRSDLSFRWDPPLGTRELANALGVKYPFEESLEKQMQCAILEFIESEKEAGKHHNDALTTPSPPIYQTNSSSFSIQPTPSEAFAGSLTTWNVATGEPVERKSRRTSYDNKKRRKVATVRKLGACDYHRKQKTEVSKSICLTIARQSTNSKTVHLPYQRRLSKPPLARKRGPKRYSAKPNELWKPTFVSQLSIHHPASHCTI